MMYRKGFVSNSSSSSFVCAISGDILEVRDEYNGTVICDHCKRAMKAQYVGDKKLIEYLMKKLEIEDKKEIEDEEGYIDSEELGNKYTIEFGTDTVYIDNQICPVCNLKYIEDKTLLEYLLKEEFHGTRDMLVKQLKEEYVTLDKLNDRLKGKA